MLYLRPYKKGDAEVIISWCRDEALFRKWTGDRYPSYPITADDMNHKYFDCNGDCAETDTFCPLTACDENGIAGHFIMKTVGGSHRILRISFVIVDDQKRGRGYGREMIRLALESAFRIAGAERVTLGVFENNKPAYACYQALGFRPVPTERPRECKVLGEMWNIIELAVNRRDYLPGGCVV